MPSTDYLTPEVRDAFRKVFFESVFAGQATNYAFDLYNTWHVMLVATAVAVILSYLYLFIVRCLGGIIIWVSIVLGWCILVAGGFYTYFYARPTYAVDDPTYKYLEYGSYVLWGLAGLEIIMIVCCLSAINLGIAVFKTTAQYIQ